MALRTNCILASEILQSTNDGNDLAPEHLKLLELVVNNQLNEQGIEEFRNLHHQVLHGEYQKPWLQGVEHLTRDHEGYVYWKGHHIEHWSGDLPYSEKGKTDAQELARRCRRLESQGIVPDAVSVILNW